MSDISRKALEDTLNTLYNQPMAAGAYRAAINDVKAEIAGIPSTESEGEATRLREALEKILTVAEDSPVKTYQHMEDIAREALSSRREDAKTTPDAIDHFVGVMEERNWKVSSGIKDGRDTDGTS